MLYWIIGGCVVIGFVMFVGFVVLLGAAAFFMSRKKAAPAAVDYSPAMQMTPAEIEKSEMKARAIDLFESQYEAKRTKAMVKEFQQVMADE